MADDHLRNVIYGAIRTVPKHVRKALISPLPQQADRAAAEVAERVKDRVESAYTLEPRKRGPNGEPL